MELISNYENALQAIYDHVGFKEDWLIAPIDDCTDKFWNTDGKSVLYADSLYIDIRAPMSLVTGTNPACSAS